MRTDRRLAVAALALAGLLWGMTVPLSKIALEWLPTGWLTFTRFALAAVILLAVVPKARLRAAVTPAVLISGAFGYGGSVVVQNAGIARTSVTHAALLMGAVPVLVAIIAAVWQRTVAQPVAWAGFAVSLAGVGVITGGPGGGATMGGDALVMLSLLVSAVFTVSQGRRLRDGDPLAVTAVQFLGAALGALAFATVTEGAPPAPAGPGPVLTMVVLAVAGTLAPFTLFAFGQSRVSAEVAGAFLNLEPLVGALAGVAIFGNPAGPIQAAGGAAILGGIALSSLPLLRPARPRPAQAQVAPSREHGLKYRPASGETVRTKTVRAEQVRAEPTVVRRGDSHQATDARPDERRAGTGQRTWRVHAHPGGRPRRRRAQPHRPGRARTGRERTGRAGPGSGPAGASRPGPARPGKGPQNKGRGGAGRPHGRTRGGGQPPARSMTTSIRLRDTSSRSWSSLRSLSIEVVLADRLLGSP